MSVTGQCSCSGAAAGRSAVAEPSELSVAARGAIREADRQMLTLAPGGEVRRSDQSFEDTLGVLSPTTVRVGRLGIVPSTALTAAVVALGPPGILPWTWPWDNRPCNSACSGVKKNVPAIGYGRSAAAAATSASNNAIKIGSSDARKRAQEDYCESADQASDCECAGAATATAVSESTTTQDYPPPDPNEHAGLTHGVQGKWYKVSGTYDVTFTGKCAH